MILAAAAAVDSFSLMAQIQMCPRPTFAAMLVIDLEVRMLSQYCIGSLAPCTSVLRFHDKWGPTPWSRGEMVVMTLIQEDGR